jgi:hypothetical protein
MHQDIGSNTIKERKDDAPLNIKRKYIIDCVDQSIARWTANQLK